MSHNEHNKDFLRWEVKPIWKIRYPSSLVGEEEGSFTIFGVDRGSMDIVRNWEKIQSLEEFNQGYVAKPTDFTFTVAIKERGASFEKFRRLAKGGILFDVEVSVLRVNDQIYGDRPEEHTEDTTYNPWLDGFEKYLGCIVQRTGETVELATFPIREFECEFLRHAIKDSREFQDIILIEGDGTNPSLSDLSLD